MNYNLNGMLAGRARLHDILQKTIFIMKLTTLLLIISFTHVSGKALSQINLRQNNVTLTTVVRAIEAQSGYVFVYDEGKITFGTVSVNLVNASIEEALKACFKNSPLSYRIVDKNIVLQRKQEAVLDSWNSDAKLQPVLVVGQVTNSLKQPLSGASVLIKRTRKGVTTDLQGRYVMKTAEPTDTLLFSYLGYETKVVPVSNAARNPIIDVVLAEATNQMDELVVQGYGTTSKRLATGNIAKVSGDDLVKQPVMNPLLALQGKVPGLVITPTSGLASGPVRVEIRGRKALNSSFPSDPLYVINGVPLTVLEVKELSPLSNGKSAVSRGFDQSGESDGQSPFFGMNANDIESIEVLKDADATAIYGSRGANGVILITTKKGMAGKTSANLSIQNGVSFPTRYFQMLNTEQYLEMRKEAFRNAGITPNVNNAVDLLTFDQNRYTDWQRYFTGSNGYTNAQGSVSGGSELVTYRLGASFANTNDLNTVSGKNQRETFSLSLHNQSRDQRLSIALDAQYGLTAVDVITNNGTITLAPNAPDPFDDQGNLNYAAWGTEHASYPFSNLKNEKDVTTSNLSSSLNISYDILKGLKATTTAGYNSTYGTDNIFQPIASLDPLSTDAKYGRAVFGSTRVNNVIVEPQLNYSTLVDKARISFLAGGTYQINTTRGGKVSGEKYTDDALLHTITNAPLIKAEDNLAKYKYAGLFVRANFNWDNKYIINLNGRRDGSSRFGTASRFGNFYSIGAAWNVSDESWMKKLLPKAISLIKIRGSYGITGSDAVGDYMYLTQYGNANSAQPAYGGLSPLLPQIQPNSDYHWQVNKQAEAGLDLGFFEDRLWLNVSAYRSLCDNQLVSFPTPDLTGFTSVIANSPANVENAGIEFALGGRIIDHKNFKWTATFNTSFNRNRLLSYPNLEKSPFASQLRIGEAVSSVYLLKFIGVDPLTGSYSFEDYNQDGVISEYGGAYSRGDRYVAVSAAPKLTGYMGHSFSYKNFSLSADFNIVKQKGKNYLYLVPVGTNTNIPYERYITRWKNPGDQALTSAIVVGGGPGASNINSSTQAYTDASYIRLQSLTFSGSLPEKFAKKLGVSGLSLNIMASNIFVLTRYKGLDPDVQDFGNTLPSRTVTAGLNCSF